MGKEQGTKDNTLISGELSKFFMMKQLKEVVRSASSGPQLAGGTYVYRTISEE